MFINWLHHPYLNSFSQGQKGTLCKQFISNGHNQDLNHQPHSLTSCLRSKCCAATETAECICLVVSKKRASSTLTRFYTSKNTTSSLGKWACDALELSSLLFTTTTIILFLFLEAEILLEIWLNVKNTMC
jgi:hypothetical protein